MALNDLRWLIANARRYIKLYILSLFCVLVGGVVALVDPLIIKWVIDRVLPSGQTGLLAVAGGAFLLTYAGRALLGVCGAQLGAQAAQRFAVRLRLRALRHLQSQSSTYCDDMSPGDFVFRIEQDVEQIGQSGDTLFSSSFRSSIFLALNVSALFLLNARLAAIILPLVPAFAFVRYRYYHRARRLSQDVQGAAAARSAFLQERLPAITQSQLLQSERRQARDFVILARDAMAAHLTRQGMEMHYSGLSLLIMGIGFGVMLTTGGYQVVSGILTIGGLVAFWGYLMRLFEPIAGLIELDTKLQRVRASIQRVREVLETPSAVKDPVPAIRLSCPRAVTIACHNTSFTYANTRVGIEEVDFSVEAGERIAIGGKTGSGKSTITKLIARLYDVHGGLIEVDGRDVRTISLDSLRSTVLLVPQEPIFFRGTFHDNLLCGCSKVTSREVEDALAIAELDTVLSAFPGGWDEQLGPKAIKLSGGERQRLALARALLRKPRALILDEATSALDASTEKRVLQNLGRLGRHITIIFVTHSPTVMKWVDRIIILADGRLTADGSHDELNLSSTSYQELCENESTPQNETLERIPADHCPTLQP